MPWFMVDDKLHGHRKTARAQVEAMGLWVLAGSWCADHLTDGFIPDYVAKRIDPRCEKHASSLVAAGFWSEGIRDGERGWQFHDWSGMQPTRAEVDEKRRQARERMRRNRERSQEVRANAQGTSQVVTPTPAQPSPAQPSPKDVGSSSGGGSPTETAQTRPPRTCPKHPNGTDTPCGRCADARKAHDAWRPPTFSTRTSMCPDHPKRKALNCADCANETTTARPDVMNQVRALAARKAVS